ncbi:tRNA (N6-isopentenyl adenosine(37)-C2)-methylthiotransferase MiaB [Candidatus Falkowbacteria bacterium CG10_big_fil_rev_8_21_14_0_10_39_11]|uniref:tRNA-2-methylthio-N(6)-dimethylallyladenosine synthase n=1 Tax=Candidatus Falkowbacteria bacterium CG10_big_fil_rev_8_21_14_0_10_39_11 TaxID=1974565 RepID=A0A2H0V3D9_9BACT|nr:MAG: tRNA (N6-isopentenyl adenosine(37)-C2)-methylthiotransferase MiaB [Candidatus Falkowbacteria bacterium CG10_big_fil_rev_8_21_14_0_10_39_11]
MEKTSKTYHIITFGCQMNRSDTERVAAVLEHVGYKSVNSIELADLVVINSCSVRQTAIDRVWGFLRNCEVIKEKREITYILTGCILDDDKKRFTKRFDFVFDIKKLAEFEAYLHTRDMVGDDYLEVLPKYSTEYQAFVPIMTGCNNFCSYCAVPYTRGRETSRKVGDVLNEVRNLVANGCVHIELLGQNVNSYDPVDVEVFSENNPFEHNFARLLWEMNQIDGLGRIYFSSAHPKDMTQEVIQAMALPNMLNYLHLALQSGSNEILAKMNRKYTSDDYRKIVQMIRHVNPNISLGTDIIVGFPGETEEDFEQTYQFYQEMDFDISFHAMYSPREGTMAAKFADDVSHEDKKKRWHRLQSQMKKITLKKNQRYKDRVVEVLVDKEYDGWCEGNSREMKRVRFQSDKSFVGKVVNVKVIEPKMWMLEGVLI